MRHEVVTLGILAFAWLVAVGIWTYAEVRYGPRPVVANPRGETERHRPGQV